MNVVVLAAAIALAAGAPARGADWGGIKGKFVYKGAVKAEPINVNKDVEFCSTHHPTDESIKLGKDNALENVFVYLYLATGKKADIHPDYKADKPKTLANKGCMFEPRALAVWTKEGLELVNDDDIGHNTNINFAVNADFNNSIAKGSPMKPPVDATEPTPAPVICNIHPWMHASILVRDNPYMAVTGEDGSFEIKNVPAGEQSFVLWHEAKGYMKDLKVGKLKADRKGQIKVKIAPGETLDLGTIEVTPDIVGK
jgi:hypothetical protein